MKNKIYLDMDGVLADFFGEIAKQAGKNSYREVSYDEIVNILKGDIVNFFVNLHSFKTNQDLIKATINLAGGYYICSSPFEYVNAPSLEQKKSLYNGSIEGKKIWIKNHLNPKPINTYFTLNKAQYATENGIPNILIDDRGENIKRWTAAGGIGIKYQADEDSLNVVINELKRYFKPRNFNEVVESYLNRI
jgi:hypothetical protein